MADERQTRQKRGDAEVGKLPMRFVRSE